MDTTDDTCWTCTVLAGPDAGGVVTLGPGRHVVGRAGVASVRCDDPTWAPFHAIVEVRGGGTARMTVLAGRVPARVDGLDLLPGAGAPLTPGCLVEIGNSLLSWTVGRPQASSPADVRHGEVHRGPRAVPTWEPEPIAPPPSWVRPPAASAAGLVPALLALGGAVAVGAVLRQAMFAVFGAFGALAGVGSWAAQRGVAARAARRAARAHAAVVAAAVDRLTAQVAEWTAHHLAVSPTAVTARRHTHGVGHDLWSRRDGDADAGLVSVGWGEADWEAVVAPPVGEVDPDWPAALLVARPPSPLPVVATLRTGTHLALRGPRPLATAVARSVLLQQVTSCGPADLRVVVVTDRPEHWTWVAQLPHARLGDGGSAVLRPEELAEVRAGVAGHTGRLLVVVDRAEWLGARTGPVRRLLHVDGGPAVASVALVDAESAVPHVCTAVLQLGRSSGARWLADTRAGLVPRRVWPSGIGHDAATALAERLGALADPEDPLSDAGRSLRAVRLVDLLVERPGGALTPAAVVAGWRAAGHDAPPRAPVGLVADDGGTSPVEIDLARDGPHGLLAGTTGSGKSELLRTLVASLAVRVPPEQLAFVLVDYKGGATFDACARLPHVVGVVTDLDDRLATRALRSLRAELLNREEVLREHGAVDLTALRTVAPAVTLPRLVVVIDEFAALAAEHPDFLRSLVGVAQRGRSLGLHLLLATQRPAGVVSDDIRANTDLRVALRVVDPAEARDIVDDPAPALLSRRAVGRAVMRLGADELVVFQVASCTATCAGASTDLDRLVGVVREAARVAGSRPPRPPWRDPLPRELAPTTGGGVGVVDDPDRQTTYALRWDRACGHLLVAGAPGSGTTSALLAVVHAALADGVQLYVIDALGDARLAALVDHPACGAVVTIGEAERLGRLVGLLRRAGAAEGADVVLAVDGIDVLRRAVDTADDGGPWDGLVSLVAAGSGAVRVVATVSQPSVLPVALLTGVTQRWVMHLTEPSDALTLGVDPRAVPAATPGRLIVAGCGLEAQLARPGTAPRADPRLPPPRRVEVLPGTVGRAGLPPPTDDDRVARLPVGVRFADLEPAVLELGQRDHVLVAGPPRSGRTSALRCVAAAWRDLHPDAWVGVLSPWRVWPSDDAVECVDSETDAASAASAAGSHALLLVDDADGVDDPSGVLAALLAGRGPLVPTVVAAATPDGLRASYGHWTAAVRRSRTGLLLAGCTDLDGDLLGATLPRRPPLAPRPGLAWLVARAAPDLVQVASVNA